MKYLPLSEQRGVIVNDKDEYLVICHCADTNMQTWEWHTKDIKPTLFNPKAAYEHIDLITAHPAGIHKEHPTHAAKRASRLAENPKSKARSPLIDTGFSNILPEHALLSATLAGTEFDPSTIQPLTGIAANGEAI